MNINFPDSEQVYIKNMIKAGYYNDESELVRDAVRLMREHFFTQEKNLMAALESGEKDIALGKFIPYTHDFLDACEKQAINNISMGKKPGSDVCP